MTRRNAQLLALLVSSLALAVFAIVPVTARNGRGPRNLMTWLTPSGLAPEAWGKVKFKDVAKFDSLRVEVHGLHPGDYGVFLAGAQLGTMTVRVSSETGEEFGKFVMTTKGTPGAVLDPRGAAVEVRDAAGAAMLSCAKFPSTKSEEMARVEIELPFTNTGAQPAASGEAEFESFKGRSEFEVEVEGLAAGSYDLVVGDAVRHTFTAAGPAELEFEFDSLPEGVGDDDDDDDLDDDGSDDDSDEDGEELLLTFDPRGLSVRVVQGTTVVLDIPIFPTE